MLLLLIAIDFSAPDSERKEIITSEPSSSEVLSNEPSTSELPSTSEVVLNERETVFESTEKQAKNIVLKLHS